MATQILTRGHVPAAMPTRAFPALESALDAVARDARRTRIKLIKSAAKSFLAIETRWRLNLLWKGLETMEADEALAVLARAEGLPSYQLMSRRVDLRGARLAFRFVRFVESRTRRHDAVITSTLHLVAPPRRPTILESVAYLRMATENRKLARTLSADRETYVARAKYWLALSSVARRAEGRRLPG